MRKTVNVQQLSEVGKHVSLNKYKRDGRIVIIFCDHI